MKIFFRIFCGFLCLLVFAFLPFLHYGVNNLNINKKDYKLILRIWNIDSFEGGKNSRTAFLRKVGLTFSKKYPEVLCMIENQTVEGSNICINKGEIPDIISSGICGVECKNYLKQINLNSHSDGGIINGKDILLLGVKGDILK